jgi:hypothetical protein
VRRCWLSLCTVRPSLSQISYLSTVILALGIARSRREPNMGCRGADRPGWCDALPKILHENCRMGKWNVMMKLICSLGHFEWDRHTVRKLSQRCLTAGWLAPRESDCSRMNSKVSSDWLPNYIKVLWTVLEIFKLAGYFPDIPGNVHCLGYSVFCRKEGNVKTKLKNQHFNGAITNHFNPPPGPDLINFFRTTAIARPICGPREKYLWPLAT